ncbi:hypothetical protein GGR57DRAFT_451165 [Xylariaceae sp. FL1272]|nr:hypothetical protein GGR57DRAFT_451165 [Xylariaceae sp. FL1272]
MTTVDQKFRLPCIFVFDSTRLRSHLFFRYLSTSSQITPILHPWVSAAMFGREHVAQHLRHSEIRQEEIDEDLGPLIGSDTFQSCCESFKKDVADAQRRGTIPVANEHWFNVFKLDQVLGLIRGEIIEPYQLGRNPTHLPDEIFDCLQPMILIRHPALSIHSIYRDALKMTKQRPGDEDFDFLCINKPLRLLFDYLTSKGRQPVVVNAEDLLWRTDDLTNNMCTSLGTIDAATLSDKWKPATEEELARLNPLRVMLTRNILESSGIERPNERPSEPSIEKIFEEWRKLYGDSVAQYLKDLAEDNMPHYEYLSQFKA